MNIFLFNRWFIPCIVLGCPNRSNDPRCAEMSWHRVCKKINDTRSDFELPARLDDIDDSMQLKNYRICDDCMCIVNNDLGVVAVNDV